MFFLVPYFLGYDDRLDLLEHLDACLSLEMRDYRRWNAVKATLTGFRTQKV